MAKIQEKEGTCPEMTADSTQTPRFRPLVPTTTTAISGEDVAEGASSQSPRKRQKINHGTIRDTHQIRPTSNLVASPGDNVPSHTVGEQENAWYWFENANKNVYESTTDTTEFNGATVSHVTLQECANV